MTRLSFVHRRGMTVGYLLLIVLIALLGMASTVWSGAGWHNVPGTACAAYNNYQANALQRNGARIYNPPGSSQNLWVICPLKRVAEDVQTAGAAYGYVNVFFSSLSAASAEVLCNIRELNYTNTYEPGGSTSGVLNTDSITATRPLSLPGVASRYFEFDTAYTGSWNYWTATCRLAPGTGINSIDMYHR